MRKTSKSLEKLPPEFVAVDDLDEDAWFDVREQSLRDRVPNYDRISAAIEAGQVPFAYLDEVLQEIDAEELVAA